MEDTLREIPLALADFNSEVLILVLMEDTLRDWDVSELNDDGES